MTAEHNNPDKNQPHTHRPFEEYFRETSHTVTFSEVATRMWDAEQSQRKLRGEIKNEWTRSIVLKELGIDESDTPGIRCFAEIAKGKEPKAVLSFYVDQDDVVKIILRSKLLLTDLFRKGTYAQVCVKKGEKEIRHEIQIQMSSVNPTHPDNLIISQALADQLGIQNGEGIIIESIYKKVSDLDLDEI